MKCGTKIICNIAKKYRDKCDFYEKEEFFCCMASLKKCCFLSFYAQNLRLMPDFLNFCMGSGGLKMLYAYVMSSKCAFNYFHLVLEYFCKSWYNESSSINENHCAKITNACYLRRGWFY